MSYVAVYIMLQTEMLVSTIGCFMPADTRVQWLANSIMDAPGLAPASSQVHKSVLTCRCSMERIVQHAEANSGNLAGMGWDGLVNTGFGG